MDDNRENKSDGKARVKM